MNKNINISKPYFRTGLFVIPLLICFLVLHYFSPPKSKHPHPYSSTIVAFEFADSPQDVHTVLSELTRDEIMALEWLNKTDFFFMICYSLFLLSFWKVTARLKKLAILPGFALVVVIYLADLIETTYLIEIGRAYMNQQDVQPYIPFIRWSSWMKWIGLALIMALIGKAIFACEVVQIMTSIILCTPVLVSIAALFGSDTLKDIFANWIMVSFVILILYCFLYKNKDAKKANSLNTS